MLARTDEKRIAALRSELQTVRLDTACSMPAIVDEVRDLLDTETVLLYSVSEVADGWHVSRWNQAGGNPRCGELLRRAVETRATSVFYYDLLLPAPSQRNRVVEATAWIDREQPGTWDASRMCREVLAPLKLHAHRQPRALLCEGPSLLAWFGALHPGPVSRRQKRLLSALVPVMQQRLTVDRHLAQAHRVSSALRGALEHVGSAAFVVGARGTIHETNAAGRVLLDEHRADVVQALVDAAAGRANRLGIELVPLAERGVPRHYLALVRRAEAETRVASCIRTCVEHWGLTPRQGEVLALVARGLANATIAAMLHVGERNIELHMTAIFDCAGVDSRAALVARVLTAD
ncbi:MAG: LuxR family transcriptional regulator [Myxococcales bacterium]|nr:LuxR family transcriptional regulator [Myxococcales bacterium]